MVSPIFRYTNPITRDPELSLRDHFILKVGDLWYMTGTSAPVWSGPCPGVKLFTSPNLLEWTFHSLLIDARKLPPDCPYLGRFWASEIHQAQGKFWLTVNSGHRGPVLGDRLMDDHNLWLFVADTVTGPYELVAGPLSIGFKNDASLFTDDDGRSYLYCSGGGLWQSEIELSSGRFLGNAGLEKICDPRDARNPDWMIGGIEGPFVIKRGGHYHLFFSAWTRGYEIGVLRAPTPLGPWELSPDSPILSVRKRRYREKQMQDEGYAHVVFEDTPDPFVEVGHCAIFPGPDDKDWLCCHYFIEGKEITGTDPVLEYADSFPQLGFEPLIYKDGWFSVNGPTWSEQTVLIGEKS